VSEPIVMSRLRRVAEIGLAVFGFVLVLGMVALVVAPIFKALDTYGGHDWDPMQAHRYLAVKTIKDFHQFPFWNPYTCGGHTWWGGLESGINLVSPWLPVYLLLPLPLAIRIEIAGIGAIGAIGMWALAGRFTKSPGARLLCAAVFLSTRWSLQASVGHAWHLYYAWVPWALFFFDRALDLSAPRSRSPNRDIVMLGVTMAMTVYSGAIYPLPHIALLLAIYALVCARASRSWRPFGVLAAAGALGVAFSAPRLLPIIDTLRRYPRLVDSPETLDLTGLVGVFTTRSEDPRPGVGPWGWHEFGIYTGWIPFVAMLAAIFFARHARERAVVAAGAFFLVLGLGRFSEYAPWALMHDYLPVFESQHVPSRWLYPSSMALIVAAVAIVERWMQRMKRPRWWFEVAYLFFAAYLALDIGLEAQRPMVGAFSRHLLTNVDMTTPFHMEKTTPPNLAYDIKDWAPSSLGVMFGNVGAKDCATFVGLHSYYEDRSGRVEGVGARAVGEEGYRGEVYASSGQGFIDILSWSPNAVTVAFRGARVGDQLVLNQNWDPGWRAQGDAASSYGDAIATQLQATDGEVTFRYVPRFFVLGCFILFATIALLVWLARARVARRLRS
jgi:hypothetical protein